MNFGEIAQVRVLEQVSHPKSPKVTRWARPADSLSPGVTIRPTSSHLITSPAAEDTSAWWDGAAKHCCTWESRCSNKPQCVWRFSSLLPGASNSIPHPTAPAFSHFIIFPSESYNSLFCLIDLCLLQLTGGPISFTLIKEWNCSWFGLSPGLKETPEVGTPSWKSGCQY